MMVRHVTLSALALSFAFIGNVTSSIATLEQEMKSICEKMERARTIDQQQRAGFQLSRMFVERRPEYAALALPEKERFVSFCLLRCDLDGEVAFNFLQLVSAHDRGRLMKGLEKRLTKKKLVALGLPANRVTEIQSLLKRIKEHPL